MFSRNRFSELTESLKSGFFADKVILTLARAKKKGAIEEADKRVLDEVIVFFNRVLEGFEWSNKPEVTMRSPDSAEAFSKATQILSRAATSSEAFKRLIEKLLTDAQKINSSLKIEGEDADDLIKFFTAYSQLEVKRTDELINPKGESKLGSWTLTKALFT